MKLNQKSLTFGVPGIILQLIGIGEQLPLLTFIGAIPLIVGCAFYSLSRGRHAAWGLLGFSFYGVLILAFLPKKK